MNLYLGVCEGTGLVGVAYVRVREHACVYYVHNYMYMSMCVCVSMHHLPRYLCSLQVNK